MRPLNNSEPLAVAVQYAPFNTSMDLKTEGGLSTFQFYRQQSAEWMPDHTHPVTFDSNGAQKDGPIRLYPIWSIIDPNDKVDVSTLVPQIYWFVGETFISTTDPTQDYYINGSVLYVRKNFTHLKGESVRCECRFTDPRDNSTFVLDKTITLAAVLQADEQWLINILCDRTRKHHPLTSPTTIYPYEAEARLGSQDKTADVAWFWDYSVDHGQTWIDIEDSDPWYVSGKNTPVLTIDADCVELITVRARIGQNPTDASPTLPNQATASLAWIIPLLRPTVYCRGGDKVLPTTELMTFGLQVHIPKHDDMTLEQQREWLLCNWALRKQGLSGGIVSLNECDVVVDVKADTLRNTNGIKFVADPQCSLRGAYANMQTSAGEYMQTSAGKYMLSRS